MPDDRNVTADERALLGAALADPGRARELLRLVDPFMFEAGPLRRAWSALARTLEAMDVDPGSLPDAVADALAGTAGAPGRVDLHTLAAAVPSAANGRYYAGRVRRAYARRRLEAMASAERLERGRDLAVADLAAGIEAEARRLVDTAQTGPVRAFLRALAAEAGAAGAAVLIVAHSTKAARNAVARGEHPGAGIVAGSAAWYDACRGVLTLERDPAGGPDRLLSADKLNYGRDGWGARLVERRDPDGAYRGLELGARLARDDLEAAKRAKRPAEAGANGAGNPYA